MILRGADTRSVITQQSTESSVGGTTIEVPRHDQQPLWDKGENPLRQAHNTGLACAAVDHVVVTGKPLPSHWYAGDSC
eukprot:jgi/Botrbrau1/21997/Bobra.0024s0013.1